MMLFITVLQTCLGSSQNYRTKSSNSSLLVKLANKGYQKALSEDKNFLAGLNVHKGHVTYKAVADAFGYEYCNPINIL